MAPIVLWRVNPLCKPHCSSVSPKTSRGQTLVVVLTRVTVGVGDRVSFIASRRKGHGSGRHILDKGQAAHRRRQ